VIKTTLYEYEVRERVGVVEWGNRGQIRWEGGGKEGRRIMMRRRRRTC